MKYIEKQIIVKNKNKKRRKSIKRSFIFKKHKPIQTGPIKSPYPFKP
jgi:hypothetical protein